MQKPAVVLLSGGIDSSTTLAMAKSEGFSVHALSFRYGQRHEVELEAARRIAATLGVERHVIVDIDLRSFGGSALTSEIEVPKGRSAEQISTGIPVTYVPARNTIFLSVALAWAEVLAAQDIFVGVNALDYSGYPDCRPEFISAFEKLASLATKVGVEGRARFVIHAPLIKMSKSQILRTGTNLGVDYSLTLSCYDPSPTGEACGACDSCHLRRKGFVEAGLNDPTRYGVARAIARATQSKRFSIHCREKELTLAVLQYSAGFLAAISGRAASRIEDQQFVNSVIQISLGPMERTAAASKRPMTLPRQSPLSGRMGLYCKDLSSALVANHCSS